LVFRQQVHAARAVDREFLRVLPYVAGTVSSEFEKMSLWLGKMGAQAVAFVHGDFGAIGAKDFNNDLAGLNKNTDEPWAKLNAEQRERIYIAISAVEGTLRQLTGRPTAISLESV